MPGYLYIRYYMGRVKRKSAFEHAQNVRIHNISLMRSLIWTYALHLNILITKTCLYNFDPLKPHFYIVKLGFPGVYIIFLYLLKNIDCVYSLEPPRRGGSNEYPQFMF